MTTIERKFVFIQGDGVEFDFDPAQNVKDASRVFIRVTFDGDGHVITLPFDTSPVDVEVRIAHDLGGYEKKVELGIIGKPDAAFDSQLAALGAVGVTVSKPVGP